MQIALPLGNFLSGWLSDRAGKIRVFLLIGSFCVIPAQFSLYSFPDSFFLTAISAFFLRFLLTANYQWLSIAAIENLGEHKFSRVRSAGTIGFLLVQALLFVLTTRIGGKEAVLNRPDETGRLGSLFFLFCLPLAFLIPKKRKTARPFRFGDAVKLLQTKEISFFFSVSFLYYFAYQVSDNYLGKFLQVSEGLNFVFLSWVFAVILEIPFLYYLPSLIQKNGNISIFYLSLIFGFIRFTILAFACFYPSKTLFLTAQFLHSILFAGYYMGAIYWIRKHSPPEIYGSVIGLYTVFSLSFGVMLGNLFYGNLLEKKVSERFIFFINPNPSLKALQLSNFFSLFFLTASIFLLLLLAFFIYRRKNKTV